VRVEGVAYEVLELLGEGGMARVHRAVRVDGRGEVAVKIPGSAAAARNLEAEATLWRSLGRHPHVVVCLGSGSVELEDGTSLPCIAAELVPGGSLRSLIDGGTLHAGTHAEVLSRCLDVALQVAWGLEHAHARGLVHQDVKPQNVLLTRDGQAKVSDFGIAGRRAGDVDPDEGHRVATGGLTPAYASPEQLAGGKLGVTSDVYSFALVVFDVLQGGCTWMTSHAGLDAFEAWLLDEDVGGGRALGVPVPLVELMRACLARVPESRPRSMREVAAELARIRQTLVVAPPLVESGVTVLALPGGARGTAIAAVRGDVFVVGQEDGGVFLLSARDGRFSPLTRHEGPVLAVAASLTGDVASLGADGLLRTCSGEERTEVALDELHDLLAFDGEVLVSVRRGGRAVSVWRDGVRVRLLDVRADPVSGLALAPGGAALWTLGKSTVRRVLLSTGHVTGVVDLAPGAPAALAAGTRDVWVATRGHEPSLLRFDGESLEPLEEVRVAERSVQGVAVGGDWRLVWGDSLHVLPPERGLALEARGPAAVAPDGRWMVALDGTSAHVVVTLRAPR
jgi:hypothetical protein